MATLGGKLIIPENGEPPGSISGGLAIGKNGVRSFYPSSYRNREQAVMRISGGKLTAATLKAIEQANPRENQTGRR